jgi:hypothetical protein
MASDALGGAHVKAVLRALQSGDTNVDFTHLYAPGVDVRQCRSDFEQVDSILKQLISLQNACGNEDTGGQPGSPCNPLLSTIKLYEAAWQGLLLSHAESDNLFTLKQRLDVCVRVWQPVFSQCMFCVFFVMPHSHDNAAHSAARTQVSFVRLQRGGGHSGAGGSPCSCSLWRAPAVRSRCTELDFRAVTAVRHLRAWCCSVSTHLPGYGVATHLRRRIHRVC